MHTLSELKSGKLKGVKRLTLSENLSSFPLEILDLADSLEILDLSNNQLSSIPDEISQLTKLKIAFLSNNCFTAVPSAFKQCHNLYMLGLKANKIEKFDEDILPTSIRWLILTDNKLKSLPSSIGKLTLLQKCTFAGNELTSLPKEMANCKNLELFRLSANKLTQIPEWLLELPKLSWLAFSGNPCSAASDSKLEEIEYESLELYELLGEGASGQIYKGYAKSFEKEVAVKLFKGDLTTDGYAKDEMQAYMSIADHPNLISVKAKIKGNDPQGLVLELIPKAYQNLGFPPDFDTCTRDTFAKDISFTIETVYGIAKAMLSVSVHLHAKGMMHGDLYAHNILFNQKNGHIYFGDFGAATFYDVNNKKFEKIEVRAFGCLVDDLLQNCRDKETSLYKSLVNLSQRCMNENVKQRPLFSEITL
ncbi:leucine-rich repeat-containing serine/threonine-protein kinase [bacterium]|nr:leucine-rich repeat-containing serine/threonine-protein kinase [bacterium]MBU1884251.1 leucine-rich repeat-containing serine/threonine-protein kinase [bacterium]